MWIQSGWEGVEDGAEPYHLHLVNIPGSNMYVHEVGACHITSSHVLLGTVVLVWSHLDMVPANLELGENPSA